MPEILNPINFGADPTGAADSQPAFQSCVDTAFGTAASPHGLSTWLNKPVFIPGGRFKLNSPVVFTDVKGGHIYGAGSGTTQISINNADCAFRTNGAAHCRFEKFEIIGSGGELVGFDLDWTGTSTIIGLEHNLLQDIVIQNPPIGLRIGNTAGGANNVLINFGCTNCSAVGIKIVGTAAVGQVLIGCGPSNNGKGIEVVNGNMAVLTGPSFANQIGSPQGYDIVLRGSGPTAIFGGRTESENFLDTTSDCHLSGMGAAADTAIFLKIGGTAKVIMDACGAPGIITGAASGATVYARGCQFPVGYHSTFTGTLYES